MPRLSPRRGKSGACPYRALLCVAALSGCPEDRPSDGTASNDAGASTDAGTPGDITERDGGTAPDDGAPRDGDTDGGTTDAGDTAVDADASDSGQAPFDASDAGEGCESVPLELTPVRADFLVLMDRSASMTQLATTDCRVPYTLTDPAYFTCVGVDCTTPNNAKSSLCGYSVDHYAPLAATVKTVTARLQTELPTGLMAFPDGAAPESCSATELVVAEALGQAPRIASALDALTRSGSSKLDDVLRALPAHFAARGPGHDGLVLVVTDGEPGCANGATSNQASMEAMRAVQTLRPSHVRVVLLGPEQPSFAGADDLLANVGRSGAAGRSFKPSEADALVDVLHKLGQCRFRLSQSRPDIRLLDVTLDGESVGFAVDNGFLIDGDDIVLSDAACLALYEPGTHTLRADYGCAY